MDKAVKRKLRLALAITGLVVGIGGQLYMVQNAPPENKARMANWVRESPAWQFYGLLGVGSIPVLIVGYIMINQKRWGQMARSGSIRNAKKVALSLWYVDGTMAEDRQQLVQLKRKAAALGMKTRVSKTRVGDDEFDDWAIVIFRHLSFGRWKFILPVRPGHPDIDKFRQLKTGDTVEFAALSQGMECALEHELCGFLRIKSVS